MIRLSSLRDEPGQERLVRICSRWQPLGEREPIDRRPARRPEEPRRGYSEPRVSQPVAPRELPKWVFHLGAVDATYVLPSAAVAEMGLESCLVTVSGCTEPRAAPGADDSDRDAQLGYCTEMENPFAQILAGRVRSLWRMIPIHLSDPATSGPLTTSSTGSLRTLSYYQWATDDPRFEPKRIDWIARSILDQWATYFDPDEKAGRSELYAAVKNTEVGWLRRRTTNACNRLADVRHALHRTRFAECDNVCGPIVIRAEALIDAAIHELNQMEQLRDRTVGRLLGTTGRIVPRGGGPRAQRMADDDAIRRIAPRVGWWDWRLACDRYALRGVKWGARGFERSCAAA
jgi:hypothetical protein